MATATPPAPPAVPQDSRRIEYDEFIEKQIRRTRATVKLVDLVSRLMTALAGLVAILLTAALVEHWLVPGGLSVFWRSVLWLGLVAAGVWFVWRQIAPLLLQRINSVYAAQAIESHSPGLKNSLLNFLLFRQHRELVPDAVYRTVEEQAATRLATADVDAAVDRSGLIHIGYLLLAVVVLAGLYKVVSPKDPVASAGRVLMPWADIPVPTRVSILEVEPGPIQVARGETVEVSAAVAGLAENEAVVLRYSTEDGQTVDYPVEMVRPEGEYRYRAKLPVDPPAGAAPGVQQPMTYFIEAGDARSKEFAIAVVDAPTIVLELIEYDYPEYTRRADRAQSGDGRIRAVEGTRVTIRAQTNHPVRRAGIDLGADGQIDIALTPIAGDDHRVAGDFVLELDPETRTQTHDLYALRFTDATGQRNRSPVHYRLEIIPDLRPEVEILQPEEVEREVRLGETVTIEVEARDPDYALASGTLFARTADGETLEQTLFEAEHEGRFLTRQPFAVPEPEFAVGNVVEYWVEVQDNRTPEPNRAATDHRQFRIIEPPPVEDHPALADQGQGGPQQPQPQDNQAPPNEQPQEAEGQQEGGAGRPQQQNQPQQQGAGDAPQQQQQRSDTGEGAKGEPSPEQQQDGGQTGGEEQQQPQDGAAQPQNGQSGAAGEAQPGDGAQGEPQPGADGAARQTPAPDGTQNGDPGAQQSGGAGQEGAREGQAAQQGADQREQSPEQGQGAADGNESQSVPSDGSDDGAALERMIEHFDQRESGDQASPDPRQSPPGQSAGERNQQQDFDEQDAHREGSGPQEQGAQEKVDGQSLEQRPTQSDGSQAQEEQPAGDEEGAGEPQQGTRQQPGGPRQEQTSEPAGAQGERQGEGEATPQDRADPSQSAEDQQQLGGEGARQQQEQQQVGEQQGQQTGETQTEPRPEQGGKGEAGANGAQPQDQPQQEDGDPSSASRPNNSQGTSGAGESAESQAAPDASEDAKPNEKRPQEGPTDTQDGGEEAASSSRSRRESDSEGEKGGDRSGGGTTGGGQDAEREGTGSPGQQESAEEGEGLSSETGQGETATGEGSDQGAGRQTGQAGEEAGRGSEQRSGEGERPGGDEAEGTRPQSEAPDGPQEPEDQPGQSHDARRPPQQREPGDRAQQPQDGGQRDGRQPGAGAGNPETGGGDAGNEIPQPPSNRNAGPVGDEANLDYARKQTDLVLDRLENQLKDREVDPELLDRLGWSEDDLKRFVDRWKSLKQAAQSPGSEGQRAQQELDQALRSLGPVRRNVTRGSGNVPTDDLQDLRSAPMPSVPAEFQDELQAYSRGISEQE